MKIADRPLAVAAIYLALALVMTWPLATVMTTQLAGDTGDTLFNCWILLWTSGQVLRAIGGDMSALAVYWNANIFYPAPLTLAYSEHLTPQMLQVLPLLGITNVVLAYNCLLLATIVLSGLGLYLFVRDLTGHPVAAFIGGLAFAFAPYRIDQFEHLQVLSSQWMPFAFFGLRRFIASGRVRALAGGAAAVAAQALSCGYYLAYFTPFVVAYAMTEMGAHGKLADRRTWRGLIVAGAAVLAIVGAFLWPALTLRQSGDVGVRAREEIEFFSADTHAFATVSTQSKLWGSLIRARPHAEGQGFPGFTIVALAAVAIAVAIARAREQARLRAFAAPGGRRPVVVALVGILSACLIVLVWVLVRGPGIVSVAGRSLRYGSDWLLVQVGVAASALLLLSPRFRALMRGVRGSPVAFFAWALVAAAWLSLGPTMHANGRRIGPGLYDVLYLWVPGFTGLRVPSLNFMIVAFMLAVLAGLGAARLPRRGLTAAAAAGVAGILLESWSGSMPTALPVRGPVYDAVRELPADAVLAELPFGDVGSEIRYTFFSGYHRKRIVNGYSGYFPARYIRLVAHLSPMPHGGDAWNELMASGVTHAIVHERAFADAQGTAVSEWMRQHGAEETAAFADGDRMFRVRP